MKFISKICLLLLCSCIGFSSAVDTITSAQVIKDPEIITSAGGQFKLGFFSPENSSFHYVGIWYNISPTTVVWVANRDNPANDSTGMVTVSEDGNIVVLNGVNETLWSSNISGPASYFTTAQLLDTGNLVLREGNSSNGRIIWESFGHPSDTFLPKMRLTSNKNTGEKQLLTSWKGPSDPSIGGFSAGLDPSNIPEIFIWYGNRTYWRSGPWDNHIFIGIPNMNSAYLDGFSVVDDKEGSVYVTYSFANESFLSNFILTDQGRLEQLYWDDGKKKWEIMFQGPETECDFYGKCGEFGICNMAISPICSCVGGFEPKNKEEWSSGNWTSGCVRVTDLQCERPNNGTQQKDDGFLKLETMKWPDFTQWSSANEEECSNQCLENCSCVAYVYNSSIGCMFWTGKLVDMQNYTTGGGDLYIRGANLATTEHDKKKENRVLVITVTVILGSAVIAICAYFSWRWLTKKKGKIGGSQETMLVNRREPNPEFINEFDTMSDTKLEELPIFSFENLATATDDFNLVNKLGEGGFGAVYKGKLQSGEEIAVKRLSRASGQGLEEFMNEVMVISKLQHRNLVMLLGCSIERDEKMLVYEYMPNRSLDSFILDPLKRKLLDWRTRFNIIEGIARGLLYLHRDSRLRIIHRDLKPSNILLDEMLNPKISDFGMARIFGANEDQAKTARVVGTYGYMSPEYAMGGQFSEKSDVFSFGVVLLEIVSGKKSTRYFSNDQSLSLLGYTWKLWNEDNIDSAVDPLIYDKCFKMEILRCINVGLLCVEEKARDRPTVSSVISMLSSEIVDLPSPKQPAFTDRDFGLDIESYDSSQRKGSVNNLTVTVVDGR